MFLSTGDFSVWNVKSLETLGRKKKQWKKYRFEGWAHMGHKGAKSLQSACRIPPLSSLTQRRSVHTVLRGCPQLQPDKCIIHIHTHTLSCRWQVTHTHGWATTSAYLLNKWRSYVVRRSSEDEFCAQPPLQCWWTASITISSQSIGWLNSVWN